MKKYLTLFLISILAIGILFSCKKNTPSPKDFAASIKEKTWWGELTYTGKPKEYYSVQFNTDNTLIWSQFSGDYAGRWAIAGKQLTITFDGNSVEIKADISNDDNLVNITDNTSASEINSGEMIANLPTILDNTFWIGATYFPVTKALQLNFKPGLQVIFNLENTPIKLIPTQKIHQIQLSVSALFFSGLLLQPVK